MQNLSAIEYLRFKRDACEAALHRLVHTKDLPKDLLTPKDVPKPSLVQERIKYTYEAINWLDAGITWYDAQTKEIPRHPSPMLASAHHLRLRVINAINHLALDLESHSVVSSAQRRIISHTLNLVLKGEL
jgi:hypothetical protein